MSETVLDYRVYNPDRGGDEEWAKGYLYRTMLEAEESGVYDKVIYRDRPHDTVSNFRVLEVVGVIEEKEDEWKIEGNSKKLQQKRLV